MTSLSGFTNLAADDAMYDIDDELCRAPDKRSSGFSSTPPGLPKAARLPINRCNLPAAILGGLTFQESPTALLIDGIATLHRPLFKLLDDIDNAPERAERFGGYMASHFRLTQQDDAGLTPGSKARAKSNYLRVVRGWAFDPDGRAAAVLKGWVESRFGLLPRHHRTSLREPGSEAWQHYVTMRAAGLYGTNALESQLDLLYAYSQYELARQFPQRTHLRLYRGINRLSDHEIIADDDIRIDHEKNADAKIVLLNNINSFSRSRERAGEFGDDILAVNVPLAKLAFFSNLLPKMLSGEEEYVVVGGLYRVRLTRQ